MCFAKNKTKTIRLPFGVPFFDVFDPRFSDFSVPIAVRGTLVFHVKHYKKFLQKNGFDGTSWDEFNSMIKSAVARYVKEFISNAPAHYSIPVLQLECKASSLSILIFEELSRRIKDEFKVEVYAVDITAIEADKTSRGYKELKEVTTDIEHDGIIAHAEVERENLRQHSRLALEDEEETARIAREDKTSFYKKLLSLCWVVGLVIVAAAIAIVIKVLL